MEDVSFSEMVRKGLSTKVIFELKGRKEPTLS